jgi:hypothetical protein
MDFMLTWKCKKEWEDPIVKEVREAREELMEEAGDLETLFRLLKVGEEKRRDRVVEYFES